MPGFPATVSVVPTRPKDVCTRVTQLLAALLCLSTTQATARLATRAQPLDVVRIWQGLAPGTEDWTGREDGADVTLPSVGKIHVITNVTIPTLTVFRPAARQANGTAMIVLPGGSFRALAWDV